MRKSLGILTGAFMVCACALLGATGTFAADKPAQKPKPAPIDPGAYEAASFKDAAAGELLYRFLKPENLKAGEKYPLVIFLHGAGERGTDNLAQLKHVAREFLKPAMRTEHPCFVLAPQCPPNKRWVEVEWGDPKPHLTPEKPSDPMTLLLALIPQIMKDNAVDPSRVYVMGLSMGGFGTWDLLARQPALFAAGIPVCGGADVTTAPAIAKIPLWIWHGDKDTVVKTVRSQLMVEALKKAGGEPKYSELPGIGHNAWTPAFVPATFEWLFQQHK